MEQAESNTTTYVGFTKQKDKIWTVEFELKKSPVNENCYFGISNFKIISIEDFDGKSYRKDNNYSIGKEYYLRKHPIVTFLSKTNTMFHDFYNRRREDYEKYTGQVTEYHSSGEIAIQYFLNNGILEGNYVALNKFGKETENAFFINGKRHGKTKYCESYSDGVKICQIDCEFNMGEMVSYNIEFSREEAIDIIQYNRYIETIDDINQTHEDITKYDETTGKYSFITNNFNVEWTEIDEKIDTYNIKCSEEYFREIYLRYFTDIPYNIIRKEY